jgi:hypothetical protein
MVKRAREPEDSPVQTCSTRNVPVATTFSRGFQKQINVVRDSVAGASGTRCEIAETGVDSDEAEHQNGS